MQEEFINIAAHELRTPAQSILGYTELAKTHPHYIEKQTQSFIEVMYRNASRIHKLTNDILDVTRIESDTLRLNKIKFDLKEVILNAIEDANKIMKPVIAFYLSYTLIDAAFVDISSFAFQLLEQLIVMVPIVKHDSSLEEKKRTLD